MSRVSRQLTVQANERLNPHEVIVFKNKVSVLQMFKCFTRHESCHASTRRTGSTRGRARQPPRSLPEVGQTLMHWMIQAISTILLPLVCHLHGDRDSGTPT